jgi:hypothetical protein
MSKQSIIPFDVTVKNTKRIGVYVPQKQIHFKNRAFFNFPATATKTLAINRNSPKESPNRKREVYEKISNEKHQCVGQPWNAAPSGDEHPITALCIHLEP